MTRVKYLYKDMTLHKIAEHLTEWFRVFPTLHYLQIYKLRQRNQWFKKDCSYDLSSYWTSSVYL
jgi:hypothetical protein